MLLRRRHDISRLEAFSDAVFAFALTLLVVALEVPKSYDELMKLMGGFLSFACCFSVLLLIWYEHNLFFRRYGMSDPYTVALNGGLLFVVMFYVYPLKFMFDSWFALFSRFPHKEIVPMNLTQMSSASAIYGLGFFLLFVMFALLYLHAYGKRDELGLQPLDVFDVRMYLGRHIVVGTILVSDGMGNMVPHAAMWQNGRKPMLRMTSAAIVALTAVGSFVAAPFAHVALAAAAAPIASSYQPVQPCRLLDTRTTAGARLTAGQTTTLQVSAHCAVPTGASAVAISSSRRATPRGLPARSRPRSA